VLYVAVPRPATLDKRLIKKRNRLGPREALTLKRKPPAYFTQDSEVSEERRMRGPDECPESTVRANLTINIL